MEREVALRILSFSKQMFACSTELVSTYVTVATKLR